MSSDLKSLVLSYAHLGAVGHHPLLRGLRRHDDQESRHHDEHSVRRPICLSDSRHELCSLEAVCSRTALTACEL